jgi:hypothetical protein
MKVFCLWHIIEYDDDSEDIKEIGLFSTHKKAQAFTEKIKTQPGFRDFPEGFEIAESLVDRGGWFEGFRTGD